MAAVPAAAGERADADLLAAGRDLAALVARHHQERAAARGRGDEALEAVGRAMDAVDHQAERIIAAPAAVTVAGFGIKAVAWPVYREPGALIDERRLWTNLLSSMPLTFNLLAPLKLDPKRATDTLTELVSFFTGQVRDVLFEHSPGRGNPTFTGDGTAFDARLRYRTPEGRNGFIAIETKYAESMQELAPPVRPRYDELSRASGLVLDPDSQALRTNPLQQLWREHILAQAMLDRGLYDEGLRLFIAPKLNWQCQAAAAAYGEQLAEQVPAGQPSSASPSRMSRQP